MLNKKKMILSDFRWILINVVQIANTNINTLVLRNIRN